MEGLCLNCLLHPLLSLSVFVSSTKFRNCLPVSHFITHFPGGSQSDEETPYFRPGRNGKHNLGEHIFDQQEARTPQVGYGYEIKSEL